MLARASRAHGAPAPLRGQMRGVASESPSHERSELHGIAQRSQQHPRFVAVHGE